MARCLNAKEIARRAEIRARKAADPSLTIRGLALAMKMSPKAVVAALAKNTWEWEHEMASWKERRYPAIVTPVIPGEELVPRAYQVDAASKSTGANTLLVLPTGLGKTIVALLHVKSELEGLAETDKAGACIVLAPTKALLVQHRDLFQKYLGMISVGLAIVDGETGPENRMAFYVSLMKQRCVLFMTPQTLLHDLDKERIARACIVDLVVDEAHHATAGDPYHLVCKDLREHGCNPRVLALTASPGETEARIVEICLNLGIDPANAIIKTNDDADVKPYIFKLDVVRYAVDLTSEYEAIRGLLIDVLREPCAWLDAAGIKGTRVADATTLPTMQALQDLIDRHAPGKVTDGLMNDDEAVTADIDPDPHDDIDVEAAVSRPSASRWEIVSRLAMAMKARHAIELVETQGLEALLAYHEKMVATLQEKPSKATLAMLQHPRYEVAVRRATNLVKNNAPAAKHPKLDALSTIMESFVRDHPSSRGIVFTKYRASIPMVVVHLGTVEGVTACRFVGQGDSSPSDKGMDREAQQDVLRRFKAGEFNVLVATKAAEEGIDVADCDLVVFYEATASLIQFIQRQGRAGRRRDGTVAILLANCTADQANAALLDTKLAKLPGIYYNVQRLRHGSTRAPSNTTPAVTCTARQPEPIVVKPSCLLSKEIAAALKAKKFTTRLDPSIPGDIMLQNGVGIRIITAGDAECWDDEMTREELPGVAKPVLAVLLDTGTNEGTAAVDRLETASRRADIEVWRFSHPGELAYLITASCQRNGMDFTS